MKIRKWMWCIPLALPIFLIVTVSAHADLYWESEVSTSGVPAGLEGLPPQARSALVDQFKPETKTVKYYLTSHASRTDLSNDIIMITEFDTMTMYQLNVGDKTYTKTDMLSGMEQDMPQDMMEIRVTPTSETKKISGYKCTKYNVTMMREKSEYWLSKDVTGYKEFKAITAKCEKKLQKDPMLWKTSVMGMASQLEGFPVKTVTNVMGITTTTTLQRIEKKSLPNDLFQVPKEYKLQELRMPRY
jgi:hypothetical protein